jgi:TonB family protein
VTARRLIVALAVCLARPCLAQEPTAAVPESALTPAAVVLIVERANQPAAQQLLATALASRNEDVRLMAARVARATNSVAQIETLERALASEAAGPTRREIRHAVESLRGGRPSAEAPAGEPADAPPTPAAATADASRPRVRLWPWPSAALARDLLRDTDCTLSKETPFLVAHIDYRPNGIINRAAIEAERLSAGCQRLARALTALTIAPSGRVIRPGVRDIVVMAFDQGYLSCLDEADRPAANVPRPEAPLRLSGTITAPRKVKNVNPVYPTDAQERRVQGVVVLDAAIAPSGCIGELVVVRSLDTLLDFAALRAVMQWRYTPTLLEGVAVPVIMTVTVSFKLEP